MQTEEIQKHLKVLSETVAGCNQCELHKTRTQTVFSRGNPEAAVAIVAEAPGQNEDEQGVPLIGKSGQLLDFTLRELGYDPQTDIYVCNVVKCRPPENRRPTSQELQACWPHIEKQLFAIPAKVILTLGTTATHAIINQVKPITQLRGQVFTYQNRICIATFHPSYIIRSGNEKSVHYPTFKSDLQLAFNKAKEIQ